MYDDEPSWQGYISLVESLYSEHPVRIDIAGTVESVAQINTQMLYDCYHVFYNNNNLTLCIAGDLDIDEILKICDRQLPTEESDTICQKIPDEPNEIYSAYAEKTMDVSKPQFYIGIKDNLFADVKDWASHEVAVKILLSLLFGESSHFFKKLYQKGIINPEFSADYENGIGYGADVWEEFYGRRAVLNLGFGFDRTQNMLWRLDHGEMANQSPKVIVVNAGTNQFSYTPNYSGDTPQEAFEGVKTLIEKLSLLAPQAEIILMALFPRLPEEKQLCINELNKLLKAYADSSQKENLHFLDLTAKFLYPDGSFNTELYQDRRCHPNSAGYRIWANALEPFFKPLI
jgi:lysophospholipase L1-like esterase